MFVQVIQGSISDRAAFEKQHEIWLEQIEPEAIGFLGSTGGVTSDGTAIMLARFDSEEAALSNSQRPEQGAWWSETERLFTDPVTFRDTTDVTTFGDGGSDDSGFVQIIQGRAIDRARYEEIMAKTEDQLRRLRPDVIGGLTAWFGDELVEAIYFTSEVEAREGEGRMEEMGEMGSEMEEMGSEMEEMTSLMADLTYCDLTAPLLGIPS